MPLIDFLLILLAVRFLFPSVFSIRRSQPQRQRTNASNQQSFSQNQPPKKNDPKYGPNDGEYIEYEEVNK